MIADLKPYPAYKESRGYFLGQVPEGWQVQALRTLITARAERNQPELPLLSVARERGVFVRDLNGDDDNYNVIPEDLSNYKVAREGDLVINKMKAWQGSMGIAPCDGLVSPAYFVYRLRIANRMYGQALLRSHPYVAEFGRASDGVRIGQWDLSIPAMRGIPVLIPPADEQDAIVRFLDHATARIGRVIRAKRKLITLLEEQTQVTRHSAITCSGQTCCTTASDWFPQVPAGWEVVPLGRVITSAIDGPHFSPTYHETGIPFLSARNVKVERWSLDDAKFISESDYQVFSRRVKPEIGDVLYTKGGTTGVARVVDLEFPFQVWVHIAVLKVQKSLVDPEYLAMCLNSPKCYEQSQLLTRGATNQDLGLGRMRSIELPLPPTVREQRALVARVKRDLEPHIAAAERAKREIELLREYQSRLIADVVTGKLDVRGASVILPDTAGDGLRALKNWRMTSWSMRVRMRWTNEYRPLRAWS